MLHPFLARRHLFRRRPVELVSAFFFPESGKRLWIPVILFGPTPTNGTGRAELRAEAVGSLEKVCASQRMKAYRINAGKCFGCDNTTTNAPDAIRTSQLSVLGRE